jgi:hypothetical protein
MNPAKLPDFQDAPHGYGAVQTIVFFAVYVLLVVGILLYLRWKLPRRDADPTQSERRPPQGS